MNTNLLSLIVVLLLLVPAHAQESVRNLESPGQHTKFLTHNQMDRWLFEGKEGETVIAHVVSGEFDPILGLAQADAKEDEHLREVDDPGSESRFAIRLPESGKYEIRIHAFKFQGGGNYALRVERFQAEPLAVGESVVGTFDRDGKSYRYFAAVKNQILVPDLKGTSADAWEMRDPTGKPLTGWAGTIPITDEGESYLIVSGPPETRYQLIVRAGRQQELTVAEEHNASLQQGEFDIWSFAGEPGEFRLLEVDKQGELFARLIFAPADEANGQPLEQPGDRPELTLLPVASRGDRLRFAAILGRVGRYQLQLLAQTQARYSVTLSDPTQPIDWGGAGQGSLPVGGAAFYHFSAQPGQLLEASLSAKTFYPVLRLYDQFGALVSMSDDDAGGLEATITHMVLNEGTYRVQVSSLGDGGSGDYRLALQETETQEVKLDGRARGTLPPGETAFWTFSGEEGQIVFLNVRSATFQPLVSVRSPDGVRLAGDQAGTEATGTLLALQLPKPGRYTVGISSRRGAGEYTIRLLDGD